MKKAQFMLIAALLSSAVHANGDLPLLKQQHKQKLNQINKLWETLPEHLQVRWLDEQAAWNKNHQKTCIQKRRETDILQCKINVIKERVEELKERYKVQKATLPEQVRLAEAILESTVSSLPTDFAATVSEFRREWRGQLAEQCSNDMSCTLKAIEEKTEEMENLLALPG